MPNSLSGKKNVRQTAKRTLANKKKKSAMRTAMRRLEEAVESGDRAAVEESVQTAYRRIDKAAKSNIIHANTAARRKSKVAKMAAKLS